MEKQRTVALLGREAGLLVLRDALIGHPALDLQAVVTHARSPKAEGGGERLELGAYRALCATAGVPLIALDHPQALALEDHVAGAIDLMIVLSWRFRIRPAMLNRLQLGGINLHRGALPAYGGAEPVRRAIEAGDSRAAITAHRLSEEIDAGAEIARVWLDMAPLPGGMTSAAYAEIVKQRLSGLYAPLARLAIGALCV